MQVTARGRRQDRARQAQRVHGVAATGQATAAKPAAAGMGREGPEGAEPPPACTHHTPRERAHGTPPQTRGKGAAGGMGKAQGEGGATSLIRVQLCAPVRQALEAEDGRQQEVGHAL